MKTINEVAKLKEPSVILILPASKDADSEIRVITSVAKAGAPNARKALNEALLNHHVGELKDGASRTPYLNLVGDDGAIDLKAIRDLLSERCKRPREFPQIFEATVLFENEDDFDPIIEASEDRLRKEILVRKSKENKEERSFPFILIPEPHKPGVPNHADCEDLPKAAVALTRSVHEFINKAGANSDGSVEPERPVPLKAAKDWLDGNVDGIPLVHKMRAVADLARKDRIVYHEPHHELTPGMLLLDEVFRAMVQEVKNIIDEIDASGDANALNNCLTKLQGFVDGINNCTGESAKYGAYILRAGPHECSLAGHKGESFHVDPTRIELILDGNEIRAASIIVGAWKGGTHSSGHTS